MIYQSFSIIVDDLQILKQLLSVQVTKELGFGNLLSGTPNDLNNSIVLFLFEKLVLEHLHDRHHHLEKYVESLTEP